MQGAANSQLEWLKATDTMEDSSRRTRLKDHSSSLLHQYAELLRCGKVAGEARQQVGELRSAVLSASMVQGADNLMQLTDELRRSAIVGDHTRIGEEVMVVASAHEQFAVSGMGRLQAVAREMQDALHELERSYYSSSVGADGADE